MHNLITLTNYRTRLALYEEAGRNKRDGLPADAPLSDSAKQQFQGPAEQLIRYLLFVNEAPLLQPANDRIVGSSSFEKTFTARGERDGAGRSLRDFDLHTRIFRYPCSYLIYSDAFDGIPEPAKGYIYHRLFEVLTGQDRSADFARLTAQDRRNIFEILLATKPGLPAEWGSYARSRNIRVATRHPHATSSQTKQGE